MIGWGEDVFSARWNDGIRGIKWWLSLPKNFIQIFFGMYAILGIIMVLINSIFPVVPYWACTCQQKLDTKLKKLGIKIEYLYKIQ